MSQLALKRWFADRLDHTHGLYRQLRRIVQRPLCSPQNLRLWVWAGVQNYARSCLDTLCLMAPPLFAACRVHVHVHKSGILLELLPSHNLYTAGVALPAPHTICSQMLHGTACPGYVGTGSTSSWLQYLKVLRCLMYERESAAYAYLSGPCPSPLEFVNK